MSLIVYEADTLVEAKIGDISFYLKPLTYEEKAKISSLQSMKSGEVDDNQMRATFFAIKYSMRNCKGLIKTDGSEYKFKFDPDGYISNESVDTIINTPLYPEIMLMCSQMVQGIPTVILSPDGGKHPNIDIILPDAKNPNAEVHVPKKKET